MYRLYWCPFTASLAPMAVLEETGVAYEAVLVDIGRRRNQSPDYLALHPCGLVPAMTLPDGRTMFESAAIIMHLCDRHAAAGLAPPPEDPGCPFFYQWMLYLADTPQPNYRRFYYPQRFTAADADLDNVRTRGVEELLANWKIVDDALAGRAWLLGERFSACDIYMLMLSSWFEPTADLYGAYPNVARCARATAAPPVVARAVERHGK